jgi:hypothetical protein
MERTLLFNFPASLRDVRNWQHLGDVAILANDRFAPEMVVPFTAAFDMTWAELSAVAVSMDV